MNIFASPKELAAAQAEIAQLKETVAALETRALTAEGNVADLAALRSELAASQAASKEASDKVVALTAQIAEFKTEAEKLKASVASQVAAQAAATVASLGHQHPISAGSNPATDAVEAIMNEPDPTRRAQLYKQHRAAVSTQFKPSINRN